MDGYTVEWSIVIDAESIIDAAKQAWGILDDATRTNQGATIIRVTNEKTKETVILDMEEAINIKDDEQLYGVIGEGHK